MLADKMKKLDDEMGGDLGARLTKIAETMADGTHPALANMPMMPLNTPNERVRTRVKFMTAAIKSGDSFPQSPKGMRDLRDWADSLAEVALSE